MADNKKPVNEEELRKAKSKELSDDDLDKATGGKKTWIDPIKPQVESNINEKY
jgi:hypothetical protein